MKRITTTILAIVLLAVPALAEETVTIVRAIDGNSLVAAFGPIQLEIRVWGIEAPECDQPGGQEAKDEARRLAQGRTARLIYPEKGRILDKYGRHLCIVEIWNPATKNWQDFGYWMIVHGRAKPNDVFPCDRHEKYKQAEKDGKALR